MSSAAAEQPKKEPGNEKSQAVSDGGAGGGAAKDHAGGVGKAKTNNNEGEKKQGGGGGGRGRQRRGGGGAPKEGEATADKDGGGGGAGGEKKKRPDVQHYKPGAFSKKNDDGVAEGVDKKPEAEGGGGGGGGQQQGKGHGKGGGGGGRGGKRSGGGQHGQGREDGGGGEVQQVAQKLDGVQLTEKGSEQQSGGGSSGGGGGGSKNRRKKKPDQVHYAPKKAGEEDGEGGQQREDSKDKANEANAEGKKEGGNRGKRKGKKGGGSKDSKGGQGQKDGGDEASKDKQPQQQGQGKNAKSQAKKDGKSAGGSQQKADHKDKHEGGNQQNGFASPNEGHDHHNQQNHRGGRGGGGGGSQHQQRQQANNHQQGGGGGKDSQQSRQQRGRGDDHLPPRLRGKDKDHHGDEANASATAGRGGRREYKRGGGRGGGHAAGRGGYHSQGNSPNRQRHHDHQGGKQGSRHETHHDTPSSRASSPPSNSSTDFSRQPQQYQQKPFAQSHVQNQQHNQRELRRDGGGMGPRSSNMHQPHRSQDARRSLSPGGPRGGLQRDREGGEWGNRYFRDRSPPDGLGGAFQPWDDRSSRGGRQGMMMGGGRGGARMDKGAAVPPKPSLPPRLQRMKEQNDRPFQDQREGAKHEGRRNVGDARPWQRDREGGRMSHVDRSEFGRYEGFPQHRQPQAQPDYSPPPPARRQQSDPLSTADSVGDWSQEVEEEELMELRRSSVDREKLPQQHAGAGGGGRPPSKGGIIRLPPSATSNMSAQRDARGGESHAWRSHAQQQPVPDSRPPQRFLFDPKNPSKPIPAPKMAHSRSPPPHPGNNGEPGMMTARLALDPRFVQRMSMPNAPGGGHGPGPGSGIGYRPPFSAAPANRFPGPHAPNGPPHPPAMAAPNRPPEWYDVKNSAIYNENKHHDTNVVTFIVNNDFTLHKIIMDGGGKLLCQLWNKEVAESRRNILHAFEHLLKTDLLFCAEFDVEFHIWKIAFYRLVEVLKLGLKEDSPDVRHMVQTYMVELLDEGIDFYEQMLCTLDNTYQLDLDTYYDVLEPRPSDKHVRCALMSTQKCLLCLGDLARYKETIQDTSNYGKARQYYQRASNVEPRNGRPFNQLAVLAVTTKRKFEAVYYNMRCLMSKNPFPSSVDSLTVIFEDVKKKWEANEKRRLEEKEQRRRAVEREKEGARLTKGTRLRKEIWIRPDGAGRRLHRTTSAQDAAEGEDADLHDMSNTDINRRFINTFLYLIGKLFTHIDMETFPLALELLQKEFRVLVSRSPLPLTYTRLVQIVALNMFSVEHTKMKSTMGSTGSSADFRSAGQDAALQLSFGIFGILVERCNRLLEDFRPTFDATSQTIFHDEDLPTLLSAVKVWCDWLLGNYDFWYPVVSEEPFIQLARLATHLERLKQRMSPILSQLLPEDELSHQLDKTRYELVKLGEDALLCGFTPWFRGLDWSVYRRFAPRALPSDLAQGVRRLDAINFCIEFLEGMENPILKWSQADNAHISLAETAFSPQDRANARLTSLLSKEEEILDESYSDDDQSRSSSVAPKGAAPPPPGPHSHEDSELHRLRHRKEELERRRAEDEREARRAQRQILSEHVSVTLEIRPRLLVPDTNCFVDHLADLAHLASCGLFQVRVPLVVLNELDGLSRGAAAKYPSSDHAFMVQDNARRALAYLKERPPNTKCLTSKGNLVASLSVTTEEDNSEGKNNDDLILDTCVNLSSTMQQQQQHSRPRQSEGAMRVVYREVVLLTDDRNLRLKAHLTDVPVNKVADFMRWAFPGGGGGAGGSNGGAEGTQS